MPSNTDILERLLPAVREAGTAIMAVYARGAEATIKDDGSPVTEADRAAEAVILAALAEVAPDIQVVSEENAASHGLAPRQRFFLVDPLDGTREFLKRDSKGSFTVNVALVEDRRPVMGLVYAPALGRLFGGDLKKGAFEMVAGARQAIRVRPLPAAGRVAVASASHRDAATDRWLAGQGITQTVSIGSSLKFCLVACGEADVYPRFGPTMEWDTAAGDAVLRAAGGCTETPDGTPFLYGKADYGNGAFIAWGRKS